MIMGKINRYLALCLFLVISLVGYAQEEQDDIFYKNSDVKRQYIEYGESIFVCDTLDNAIICIYNSKDKYWGKEQQFTDDTKWTKATLLGKGNLVKSTSGQARHMMNIVDNAFTKDMATQLNKTMLIISVHINSSDGTIAGVGFMFNKGDEYENIPIGVYKEIEDEIKNNLVFELTPLAQKLNFNQLSWLQCPKGRAEVLPEDDTEEDDNETTNTNIGTINFNKDVPTTNRGTMTTIGGVRKGTTTNP